MRPFAPQLARSANKSLSFQRISALTSYFTTPASTIQQQNRMSSSTDVGELKIESTDIKTAPGVELSEEQRTLVGSVLDLFAGRPSLAKLQLWKDDGVFTDPINHAKGRKEFEAQWYGLQSAFSEIERKSHLVTSAGNPISFDLSNFYKVKGIGMEQLMNSTVNIFVEDGKIAKVEDKWDGKLPDSAISNAFRRMNAVVAPKIVGVPKDAEEDAKRGN